MKSSTLVRVDIPGYLQCEFSMVPPPAEWQVSADDQVQYSHINFKLLQLAISPLAHGVLGYTQHLQFVDGEPVMQGFDADGKGVLEGVAADYEVETLLSSQFKYSVTASEVA